MKYVTQSTPLRALHAHTRTLRLSSCPRGQGGLVLFNNTRSIVLHFRSQQALGRPFQFCGNKKICQILGKAS